ncbi:hypothetical protein MY11210_000601 [Beauveria gryllotalpidicola]
MTEQNRDAPQSDGKLTLADSSANMVRLSDANPYTNERLFAAAREKKGSEGTGQ